MSDNDNTDKIYKIKNANDIINELNIYKEKKGDKIIHQVDLEALRIVYPDSIYKDCVKNTDLFFIGLQAIQDNNIFLKEVETKLSKMEMIMNSLVNDTINLNKKLLAIYKKSNELKTLFDC